MDHSLLPKGNKKNPAHWLNANATGVPFPCLQKPEGSKWVFAILEIMTNPAVISVSAENLPRSLHLRPSGS